MDSRERLLTALNNQKPDHLPCQVHSWMRYYLDTYLNGCDQYKAYRSFPGMDWVIYPTRGRQALFHRWV
jgi:uroporphyrinogen decarboxylase